ncbi:MAG TPA: hypothetical protein VFW83_11205 [Bryobacteraceae bacterium]|nr:hypothetical protein [Bryobacteraceae bacterium]
MLTPLAFIFAGGGFVQITGPQTVASSSQWLFEPSSAVTASTWVHSFMNYASPTSFTGWTASWDPQTGAAPLPGLKIGPVVPFGSDSTVPIPVSGLALHEWKPYVTGVSPLPAH